MISGRPEGADRPTGKPKSSWNYVGTGLEKSQKAIRKDFFLVRQEGGGGGGKKQNRESIGEGAERRSAYAKASASAEATAVKTAVKMRRTR